jgi:ech hydrogenase subunit F
MGFSLTGMTLKNMVTKPITRRYPFEPQVYTSLTRGHIANDMEKCILCSICAKTCPATALTVDKEAGTWTIDRYSCVQCMACVRSCPPRTQSLSMQPEYAAVAVEKSVETFTKPEPEEAAEAEATETPAE